MYAAGNLNKWNEYSRQNKVRISYSGVKELISVNTMSNVYQS